MSSRRSHPGAEGSGHGGIPEPDDDRLERAGRELHEEQLGQSARALAPSLVGLPTSIAEAAVTEAGLSIRFHGHPDFVTEEFLPGQITACVDADVVVSVTVG